MIGIVSGHRKPPQKCLEFLVICLGTNTRPLSDSITSRHHIIVIIIIIRNKASSGNERIVISNNEGRRKCRDKILPNCAYSLQSGSNIDLSLLHQRARIPDQRVSYYFYYSSSTAANAIASESSDMVKTAWTTTICTTILLCLATNRTSREKESNQKFSGKSRSQKSPLKNSFAFLHTRRGRTSRKVTSLNNSPESDSERRNRESYKT